MKRLYSFLTGIFLSFLTLVPVSGQHFYLYTGSYTSSAEEGINVYDFDAAKPAVTYLFTIKGTENPSFLIIHPSGKFLYAVNELMTYQNKPSGSVSSFSINSSTGKLTFLNKQATEGTAPCHLAFDPSGKWLFVANYGSGNLSVFPLPEEGTIGSSSDLVQHHGHGTVADRQEGPHAHQAVFDKNNNVLYVNDLGLDKVFRYRFNPVTGKLSPDAPPWISTKTGFGPRHLVAGKNGKYLYVLGELASAVTVFSLSSHSKPKEIQYISMLPKGYTGENTAAEITCSPDGKYLFASNRGDNSLVEYSIDPKSGMLTVKNFYPSGGENPRYFCFDPTGSYLFCANQTSGNIIAYRYNKKNGSLQPTGIEIKLPKPVCIAFLQK